MKKLLKNFHPCTTLRTQNLFNHKIFKIKISQLLAHLKICQTIKFKICISLLWHLSCERSIFQIIIVKRLGFVCSLVIVNPNDRSCTMIPNVNDKKRTQFNSYMQESNMMDYGNIMSLIDIFHARDLFLKIETVKKDKFSLSSYFLLWWKYNLKNEWWKIVDNLI